MANIELAGIPIRMEHRFSDLAQLCRDYVTHEEPVITLSVTQAEIEAERAKQADVFTDGYLETICLYRKLALEVLKYDVFLMHASVLEVDGEGYAFLAHSGTGKTTQTRLWLEQFGDRSRVINGDKPLIRVVPDGDGWKFVAYGTPWCGKEGMGCKASVPLKALFFLERATVPTCEPADQEYAVDRLFHQLLMPEDPEKMMLLLDLADRLVETVPCYRLCCDMTEVSVMVAYDAASNRNNSDRRSSAVFPAEVPDSGYEQSVSQEATR